MRVATSSRSGSPPLLVGVEGQYPDQKGLAVERVLPKEDRAPGGSQGPLSFARVAETLSLPADLAPPGDIAIERENFRLCFSIVTCRANSNPDVGGVIGSELLLREIDWTRSWSADLG